MVLLIFQELWNTLIVNQMLTNPMALKDKCGIGGHLSFENNTYWSQSNYKAIHIQNKQIEIMGKLRERSRNYQEINV